MYPSTQTSSHSPPGGGRIDSKLRRASDAAWRATHLFEQLGDAKGESTALTTAAHVSMPLGPNEEGVQAALLCVRYETGAAHDPRLHLHLPGPRLFVERRSRPRPSRVREGDERRATVRTRRERLSPRLNQVGLNRHGYSTSVSGRAHS
jgi:hypothetical protein